MWRPLTALLGLAIEPICIDLPGHGVRSNEKYQDHANTTRELAEFIRSEHAGGIHVVGFSLGAQLAISLASDFPQLVKSAVIVSGESVPAPMPRATIWLLKCALPLARYKWFARAQAKDLSIPSELIDDYIQDSSNISSETLLNSVEENITFVLPEGWSTFPGRVHVLVGEKERGLMQNSAKVTHAAATDSFLTTVKGSAHDIPFTNPQLLAEIIGHVVDPIR